MSPNTRFYVDPQSRAAQQAQTDLRAHDVTDAVQMAQMASWPVATWFTGNATPAQTQAGVADVMSKATTRHQVPVLVAYNIPGRDCSGYSSGGASDTPGYLAWLDGFGAGIGNGRAVVILEPDGLALSPDQCGRTAAQQADRNLQMNLAVQRLEQQPRTVVYIDAGHSNWHLVGDMAQRLITGGLGNAQGFFLNVANFKTDTDLIRYGTLVSKCVWYLDHVAGALAGDCPSQYAPAATANAWYAAHIPATASLGHFVIDSGRNGQGPWLVAAGTYPDNQTWCNPPGRGLGVRPTADTGVPLLDAYLWVKTPGNSDGSCNRGVAGATTDPVYDNVLDPPAGAWWPELAHSLAHNANPPLNFNWNGLR